VIRLAEALGHDAVEAEDAELLEPLRGQLAVHRGGREMNELVLHGGEELVQLFAAILDRQLRKVLRLQREQVEDVVVGRVLLREFFDPRLRGMDALQQVVEREPSFDRHDDLAVEHELFLLQCARRVGDFGKVARQRLAGLRLNVDVVAVAEDDGAEAVPLRLELPRLAGGDLVDALRFHWRVRRLDWECHFLKVL
jgi:hypothetical protein